MKVSISNFVVSARNRDNGKLSYVSRDYETIDDKPCPLFTDSLEKAMQVVADDTTIGTIVEYLNLSFGDKFEFTLKPYSWFYL